AFVGLVAVPLDPGHPVGGFGGVIPLLEPLVPPPLGEGPPDLEEQHPPLDEQPLEPDHLLALPPAGAPLPPALAAVVDGVGVPGAQEDASLGLGGQVAPEAPEGGAAPLLVGGLAEGMGVNVVGVHP